MTNIYYQNRENLFKIELLFLFISMIVAERHEFWFPVFLEKDFKQKAAIGKGYPTAS